MIWQENLSLDWLLNLWAKPIINNTTKSQSFECNGRCVKKYLSLVNRKMAFEIFSEGIQNTVSQLNLKQMPEDLHKVPISESCPILCVCWKASQWSKMLVLVVYHSHQCKLLVKHLALLKNKIKKLYITCMYLMCATNASSRNMNFRASLTPKIQGVITI